MKNTRSIRHSRATGLVVLAALGFFAGCGSGGGDTSSLFVPVSTKEAVTATTKIVVNGKWLVFQADEASSGTGGLGKNFNALNSDNGVFDTDTTDQIAVVVNMSAKTEHVLNVACSEIAIVKNDIYLAVSEAADNFDWNQDGDINDFVLVHYPKPVGALTTSSQSAPDVEYVDDLESSGNIHLESVSSRLYYTRDDGKAGLVNGDTTLAYIDPVASATTPVTVTDVVTSFVHHPRILGVDEDLILLYQDENVEALDLNNDVDATDGFVLALLDGTDITAKIRNVGLGLRDEDAPFRAKKTAAHDWLVGFLVNEASQANFPNGLNDPSNGVFGFDATWKPQNCPTYSDTDTLDDVLHYLNFKNWDTNPVTHPPINTGIVGREKVVCVTGAVATISDEGDESSNTGGCDLNHDNDKTDEIVRWTLTTLPVHPFRLEAELIAVADGTPGGTFGLTDLTDRLIAVVDEAKDSRNWDNNAANNKLIGWLNPAAGASAVWTFQHSTSGTAYFGTPWLGEKSPRDFIRCAFQESVWAQNNPLGTGGDNNDGDTADSLPARSSFGSLTDLDFFWPQIAVSASNAGVTIFNNTLFFRIDEVADNRDWNFDNLKNAACLGRTGLTGANFLSLGTLNNLPRNAVEGGGNIGAAWIVDENLDHRDYDKNGVHTGFVVRWCQIGP